MTPLGGGRKRDGERVHDLFRDSVLHGKDIAHRLVELAGPQRAPSVTRSSRALTRMRCLIELDGTIEHSSDL